MIYFDPLTLSSWKERHITEVSCHVTDTGCAGHKIRIEEGGDDGLKGRIEQDGLMVYLALENFSLLENSTLTWTGKKWILKSDAINTRCGCGSSFSLKSGNAIQDKIALMKLAMQQKKEGIH